MSAPTTSRAALPAFMTGQVARFLLLGGTAAAINWLVRFPLALVLPGEVAILVAYFIGMSAGFLLYRAYVFPGSVDSLPRQVAVFLAVNLVGAVVVLAITQALLAWIAVDLAPTTIREGFAHGVAIGIGAVVNFFGHKLLTFRTARTRPAPGDA